MRILIVDDEEQFVQLLVRELDARGYDVCWAMNGKGALELLRTEKVDVVLLDMNLGPGMSGHDVARRLPRGVHLVIITGSDPDEVRAETQIGQSVILGKPLVLDDLFRVLHRLA